MHIFWYRFDVDTNIISHFSVGSSLGTVENGHGRSMFFTENAMNITSKRDEGDGQHEGEG